MLKSFLEVAFNGFHRHRTDETRGSLLVQIDGQLTDNMRALRLTASLIDWMVSLGVTTSDATHYGLAVSSTFCSRKVHIEIIHTIIMIHQDRGDSSEPLTITRSVLPRQTDYRKIRMLQDLADAIESGELSLADAEHELDSIVNKRRLYPQWLSHLSAGLLSSGVMLMFSHDPIVWALALIMGVAVSYTLFWLARMGLPSFYSQAAAGFVVVVAAALASFLAANDFIPLLEHRDPTFIVVGGIVLLVAGMMITSAFQDAIDEYYITAGSRLLKVVMMTGGIVLGATIGLYVATKLGVELATTSDRLALSDTSYQYIGAAVLAAAFALGNQARWTSVVSAGVVGAVSLYGFSVMTDFGFGIIPASGVAAIIVGLAATTFSHLFRVPTNAILDAGIIPLVPGLTFYAALSHIAQSVPNSSEFDFGVALLMRAILIAVIIAAGATVGNIIGRPARRRLIRLRNRLPRYRLGKRP